MARQGYGRHGYQATGINDTGSQVSVNRWNDDLSDYGLLGFTSKEYTIDGSGVVDIDTTATDNTGQSSVIIVESAGGSSVDDDLDQITTAETNPYDLLYVFAKSTGNTITVRDDTGSGAGKIQVLSTTTLSTTVPLILIRVGTAGGATAGDDWIQYGGGGSVSANDLTGTVLKNTVVTSSLTAVGAVATGTWESTDVAVAHGGTGSSTASAARTALGVAIGSDVQIYNSATALTTNKISDFASSTSSELAGKISDETGSGSLVFATSPTLVTPALGTPASGNLADCTFPTLNQSTTGSSASCTGLSATATALATGRTIAMTGDVAWTSASFDGSGNVTATSTIQTDAVDIAMLSATGTASATTFLCGDNTWKAAGGSTTWTDNHDFDTYYYDQQVISKPADPAADNGRFYVKEIDSNNDGVFCIIRKNAGFEEVQIV